MAYLSKNNNKNNLKRKIVFLTVSFLVILLFILGKFSFANSFLIKVVKPLADLKNNSVEFTEDFVYFLKFKKSLVENNKLIKEELFENKLALINLKILEEENLALKKILQRNDLDSSLILANIVLKPGLSIYNSLILDIGVNYGVKKGDKVLAGDNIIIGEIQEVHSKTSKVRLYSFPKDKIEVAVGFNKILTIAEGKGDGTFEIKLPQGTSINKGDVVTLPQENLRILGIVEEIIINPEDPFEKILFKSPVNFFELKWVQIIKE